MSVLGQTLIGQCACRIVWVNSRSLNGTTSRTLVVLDRVMDRCDRDGGWDRRLALLHSTQLRSLGIGDRRLGNNYLAWWSRDSLLAWWSIDIRNSSKLAIPSTIPAIPSQRVPQAVQSAPEKGAAVGLTQPPQAALSVVQ
jgi:hypothetical protein